MWPGALLSDRNGTMGVVQDQKGTIGVVDDEPNIADLVDMYLAREGFRVLKVGTGEAGLQAIREHRPRLVVLDVGLPDLDGREVCKRVRGAGEVGLQSIRDRGPRLVVLDVGLPDLDGLEVCKRLRATSQIPVIFLTARDSEVDRVVGLELGGDDYLTKPFSPARLVARAK